jgi:hypothetical protein
MAGSAVVLGDDALHPVTEPARERDRGLPPRYFTY